MYEILLFCLPAEWEESFQAQQQCTSCSKLADQQIFNPYPINMCYANAIIL